MRPRSFTMFFFVARRGEVFKGFWLGVPKGRDHWEDLDEVGRYGSMGQTAFGWVRIGSSVGLL
jgi:hypothetical protein